MANLFQNVVYRYPSSIYLTAMSVICFFFMGFLVISELMGSIYSTLNFGTPTNLVKKVKLSSRTGMLILYTPAALVGLASFLMTVGLGF